MAQEDLSVQVQQQMTAEEEQRLKYLQFVQVAAAYAEVCFTNLYGYAKERSGPLKPGVESVEGTVKTVVGPVYNKYHDIPAHLLTFVDRKVDLSVTKLDSRVPPVVKQASSKALSAAQKAPEAARVVASELKRAGVVDTASSCAKSVYSMCEPTAKDLYAKYEPKAEQCAVSAWRKVNQVLPKVVDVVVPTAAYCSEKYNQTVQSTAEKGYRVSSYLPFVPTEKIAMVFAEKAPEAEPLVASHGEADVAIH